MKAITRFLSRLMVVAWLVSTCVVLAPPAAGWVSPVKAEDTSYRTVIVYGAANNNLETATWANVATGEYNNQYINTRTALYAGSSYPGNVYRKYLDDDSGWDVIGSNLGDAVLDLAEYQGQLYAGTMDPGNPGSVYRYDGGSDWTEVGCFVSGEQVSALVVFKGELYAGTSWAGAKLYRYNGPDDWELVWQDEQQGYVYLGIRSLHVWGDILFMGISEYTFDIIWRWDGLGDPQLVMQTDGICIWDIESYADNLYASTWHGYLYNSSNGTTWNTFSDYINGDGARNIWDIEEFDGYLYAGSDWIGDGSQEARLYRFDADPTPQKVWELSVGNLNEGILSMVTDGHYLYLGTGGEAGYYQQPEGTGMVWRYDGASMEPFPEGVDMKSGIQTLYLALDATSPSKPSLMYPANGAKTSDTTPTFDWSDVTDPSGVSYGLQADNDADFSSPIISKEGLRDSTYTLTEGEALSEGTYYWRVEAIDGVGNTAGWTGPFSFTIDTTPPSKPSQCPVSGVKINDTTPTFAWSDVSDPSGVSYSLQVDNDADFSSPIISKEGLTDSTYTLTEGEALSEGIYYWRVEAIDGVGNTAGWTGPFSFIIDTTAPPKPLLQSPADGAKISDTTPTFDWSDVSDLSGVTYSLQIDNEADFSSPITSIGIEGSIGSTHTLFEAISDGSYYWRVEAIDEVGNTAGWTGPFSFTIDTTAPPKPLLQSLADGAKISDTTPTFDWSGVTDPSGVTYSLQVDNEAGFPSPIISKEGLTASTYTLTEDDSLSEGTYYWRVKAVDGVGNTAGWTESFSFTEKKGEAGSCGCGSGTKTSTSELSIGLGIMSFCWGTGLCVVRKVSRCRKAKN
jgi:hypothetical protein